MMCGGDARWGRVTRGGGGVFVNWARTLCGLGKRMCLRSLLGRDLNINEVMFYIVYVRDGWSMEVCLILE